MDGGTPSLGPYGLLRQCGSVLAATLGDPGGIGPEIIVKALADPRRRTGCKVRIYGPESVLARAAAGAGIAPFWVKTDPARELPDADTVVLDTPIGFDPPPNPDARSGELSYELVRSACADAKRPQGDPRRVDAIVTAPISKEAWSLAGHTRFPGHTELLASEFGVERFGMFFHAPPDQGRRGLNVILATIHEPISKVPLLLTVRRVLDAIELGNETCIRLGVPAPRVAVCGLNPHAGENGLLGTEDAAVIAPAVAEAKACGINASGPFPGDTVFNRAVAGHFDLVVAMYHDQGLIPLKLLAWDRAVNMTVGLPVVRTSPDHGTAFDIAGKNRADASSMACAFELGARIVTSGPNAPSGS